MKRGNDNSQLRADEVESLNDEESEERGTFQRASADVLATRKIFKSKRTTIDSAPSTAPAPFNFGTGLPSQPKFETSVTASAPANPFSGFSGLITKPAEQSKTVTAANPFSGFQGLSNNNSSKPTESSNSNAFGFGNSTVPAASVKSTGSFTTSIPQTSITAPASVGFSFAPSSSTATSTAISTSSTSNSISTGGENEYKKKMRKLNSSFLSWANRQITEHPLSIWKDGVKDYIKYTSDLAAKYGAVDAVVTTNSGAPVSAEIKPFGFGSTPTPTLPTSAPTPVAIAPPAASFSIAPAPIVFGAPTNAASTAPSSFKDTFAFAAPATVKPPAATPSFSFGAAAGAAPAGGSFSSSFAFPSAAPAAAVPAVSGFGGFGASSFPPLPAVASSFSLPSNNFSFAPAAASTVNAAAGDEEGGDDEGEPILEPEKVLRDVNDTDTILLDVPCKLYGYSKAGNEWKDTGKGSFRVTRSADTNKQRMLVRNPIGKLTFNAGFYKGMQIEKVKGGVRFSAFVVTDEPSIGGAAAVAPKPELKGFMVKMKEVDIPNAMTILEAGVASCD